MCACESSVRAELRRHPLTYAPEEIFERCGATADKFLQYLQMNAPDYLEHLGFDTLASILDLYSRCDEVSGRFGRSVLDVSANGTSASAGGVRFRNQYSTSMFTRGTLFLNDCKTTATGGESAHACLNGARGGLRQLKPPWGFRLFQQVFFFYFNTLLSFAIDKAFENDPF